jgi:putative flavoprotein involved in K+ transport
VREHVDTLVIGAGQAGLAMSHALRERGCEHLVVERARVAERWRTQRWDSLHFQFPNWSIELPGLAWAGSDPDAFSPKDEVVAFIERYAAHVQAPLRTGIEVLSLKPAPDGERHLATTDAGEIVARNVVVATGPYQQPRMPTLSGAIPARLLQLHASEYRHPSQLPAGAVLVVGSGASGCQIAEELLASDRRVFLCVGRHLRMPRRYRGHDAIHWRRALGLLDQTIDDTPANERRTVPLVTGVGGGHTVDLADYASGGMTLLGHLVAADGEELRFAPDLARSLDEGDRSHDAFLAAVDAHVARHAIDCDRPDVERCGARTPPASPLTLDLARERVATVIWATGYRYDFAWVRLPVFADGVPLHRRGVTGAAGLCFLGLPWLHKRKSSFLAGVGEDAAYLAQHIAERSRGGTS